jgi:uncharacterized membrane protein
MAGDKEHAGYNREVYYFIASIGLSCLASLTLLLGRIIFSGSLRYVFLVWNLVLAIIPLMLAWWLYERLRTLSWFKWQQVFITLLFLGFLPNTFYLITDFVHLRPTDEVGLYFDVVMLSSFVFNGIILGLTSIYLLHKRLLRRMGERDSLGIIAVVFFLASFAAYLGRFTRFNSWDVILRPAGLLFDVSDRFVNPGQHSDTYLATITLFFVLFFTYLVIYSALRLVKNPKPSTRN